MSSNSKSREEVGGGDFDGGGSMTYLVQDRVLTCCLEHADFSG
jgi:hypothetical protein